ncbi:MAG: CopD family protein [Hyphomicrobiaceae bacterium]|nr:CopD family protein [Hyphomicrobiaceae bacterium]
MNGWLASAVPHLKALHVATLSIWCAGILSLPLMLARHDRAIMQVEYARLRHYTHFAYSYGVTPAAVVAIVSGTLLIFVREVFVPWMFLKLVFVALLVAAHAWIGHTVIAVAETPGMGRPPRPARQVTLVTLPILAILVLVLGKPGFAWLEFPAWLTVPRGAQLPFDVPSR